MPKKNKKMMKKKYGKGDSNDDWAEFDKAVGEKNYDKIARNAKIKNVLNDNKGKIALGLASIPILYSGYKYIKNKLKKKKNNGK